MLFGKLFDPITIGTLVLRNRLMRSATAERLADPLNGAPRPRLGALYRTLAEGGVGLIVTGHAYVDPSGKCHPEMASIASDGSATAWRSAIRPAQDAGAAVMLQINHGGSGCDPNATPGTISPSGVQANPANASRAMSEQEIGAIVAAYGQAARRAREAGFDGLQLHGAHGYLLSQFLTPATNLRTDRWGKGAEGRRAFLAELMAEIRRQVGPEYPVWLKLGLAGAPEHGPSIAEGAATVVACARLGLDCVEISHGLGVPSECKGTGEAPYLPMAQAARDALGSNVSAAQSGRPPFPLALVNGLRSRGVMEEVLASGVVQLISLCRPLIREPDLPNKLMQGRASRASCVRCDRCWPEGPELGVACHHARAERSAQ